MFHEYLANYSHQMSQHNFYIDVEMIYFRENANHSLFV